VRRLNVGLVASVCILALAFALIRPAWLAAAGPVPTKPDDTSSGVSITFGSKGPAVDVQVLTHGRIAEVVHAPATIKSGSEVAVAAPFDGRVRELCVDEGDAVIASQVIFRLDPIEYDDKLHEAELELDRKRAARIEADAELKEAEHRWEEAKREPSTLTEARLKVGQSELNNKLSSSELENADAKLKRATKMLEDHVGTQQDVDVAISDKKSAEFKLQISNGELDLARKTVVFQERQWKTDRAGAEKAYDTSKTHVERARADEVAADVALVRARRDREKCDVRTPIAGVVTRRNVNEGELTSRPLAADQPQYIVSDLSHVLAYADVDEGDVVKCAQGQPAHVRVNALGDDVKIPGKVIDVANRAYQKANEDTKSFRVRILLSSADENVKKLRPDMSANADIETRTSKDDALRVPLQAVLHKTEKDIKGEDSTEGRIAMGPEKPKEEQKDWIFILDGEKVAVRQLTLGVQDGEFAEVKSGLTGTEKVVTGPYRSLEGLKAGDAVRATLKEAPKPDAIAAATSASAR
jgi:HlyD family secretion protein